MIMLFHENLEVADCDEFGDAAWVECSGHARVPVTAISLRRKHSQERFTYIEFFPASKLLSDYFHGHFGFNR
jgi:hypothetical protein